MQGDRHEAGGDEAPPAGDLDPVPAKPSSAGSSVIDAIIVTATTIGGADGEAATRTPTSMTSMPSSEMTTVVPANRTARPAVSMATAVALLGAERRGGGPPGSG